MSFNFGDRVEIGGRTMLRPGFSLVGLAGMVFVTAPNAPSGTTTVRIDWGAFNYTEENGYPEDSLPPIVNVPSEHLLLLEPIETTYGVRKPVLVANPAAPRAVHLDIVHGGAEESVKPLVQDAPLAPAQEDDDEPPRPRLRLV